MPVDVCSRREGEDGDLAPRSEPESSNEAPRAKRFAAIGSTVLKRALATTYKDAANQLERNGGLSSGVRSQQMVQQARERIEVGSHARTLAHVVWCVSVLWQRELTFAVALCVALVGAGSRLEHEQAVGAAEHCQWATR